MTRFGADSPRPCRSLAARATLAAVAALALLALPAGAQPVPSPPVGRTLDLEALDRSADPCNDFYRFACGGWHAASPRPADAAFWSKPFTQFSRQVDDFVETMIEALAAGGEGDDAGRSPDERRVGDHFASCLDTDRIEERGLAPLRAELALVESLRSTGDLGRVLGALHRSLPYAANDGEPLVYVYSSGDPVEGGRARRLWLGPAGLGLPGASYYLDEDDESVAVRADYREHIALMLRLSGETAEEASRDAEAVVALETALAGARTANRVTRNDARSLANLVTPEELDALTPSLGWGDYLRAHGIADDETLNVTEPEYLRSLEELVAGVPAEDWRAYLRWQLVLERAKLLPVAFREASFAFHGRRLQDQDAPPDRRRECIDHLKRDLPDALSRLFVARAFRPEMRSRTTELFEEVREVMRGRIEGAAWMAAETRRRALVKLDALHLAVGPPGAWHDDPHLVIRRDDFYGNVVRAGEAQRRAGLSGLGLPVGLDDRSEPETWVGAGYYSRRNAIVVTTAALLLFDGGADDPAVLYGGLGHLLAHELSHGFDPLGRSYGPEGGLDDWWTAGDGERFDRRAACVADEFSRYEYAPGIPVDGEFVVSEQAAELTAWSLALEAWRHATAEKPAAERDGFTPLQRFLLASAQLWCTDATDGRWRALAAGGSSKTWGAPAVHGTVRHLPAFAEAFGCPAGSPLVVPEGERCAIW